MSAATDYAAAMNTVLATAPASFTGPGGLMTASVNTDGTCNIYFNGVNIKVPPAVLLLFATWITATFT